jgi:hypothetical protein
MAGSRNCPGACMNGLSLPVDEERGLIERCAAHDGDHYDDLVASAQFFRVQLIDKRSDAQGQRRRKRADGFEEIISRNRRFEKLCRGRKIYIRRLPNLRDRAREELPEAVFGKLPAKGVRGQHW